jgi:hypothetical protein
MVITVERYAPCILGYGTSPATVGRGIGGQAARLKYTDDGAEPMRRISGIGSALLLAALVGCRSDSSTPTGPGRDQGPARSLGATGTALMECPASATETSTGLIGPLGGTLVVGGIQITVPANAVLSPTSFTLTVPQSNYLEIDLKAGDAEHFVFESPVVVAIDYGRCGLSRFHSALSAWNIDPATKALLEEMPSVDSQLTHTIIFSTIHFSGYAVAD